MAVANDKEQAEILLQAIGDIYAATPELHDSLELQRNQVVNTATEGTMSSSRPIAQPSPGGDRVRL